jgi:hypothetical protein
MRACIRNRIHPLTEELEMCHKSFALFLDPPLYIPNIHLDGAGPVKALQNVLDGSKPSPKRSS